MPKEQKSVIAIDLGSSRVRVLAAKPDAYGHMEITAIGHGPALGVQRGIVTNIDEASKSVRDALQNAGIDSRLQGARVCAGISGKHVTSLNATGEVVPTRGDAQITDKDVYRALMAARPTGLVEGLSLVHQVERAYRVDGHRAQQDVIGMRGSKLEVEAHFVAANEAAIANLKKVMRMAGAEIDQLVASGLASAQAVVRAEEREMGVVLLNIGAGTTDIVAYGEGSIFHTSCLPLGGNQLTNDAAISLNTSFHVAEAVIQEHGRGSNAGINEEEELTIQCFGVRGQRLLRRRFLNEIIRLQLTEILHLSLARARETMPSMRPTAGVVLSGGVAQLPGIEVLAEATLQMPARVGIFTQNGEGPAILEGTAFTTAIGILQVAVDPGFAPIEERKTANRSPLKLLPQLIGMKL